MLKNSRKDAANGIDTMIIKSSCFLIHCCTFHTALARKVESNVHSLTAFQVISVQQISYLLLQCCLPTPSCSILATTNWYYIVCVLDNDDLRDSASAGVHLHVQVFF